MLKDYEAFSGFSVTSLSAAKAFYQDVLGLKIEQQGEMGLELKLN